MCYLWYERVSSGHKAKVEEREAEQVTQVVQGQNTSWGEGVLKSPNLLGSVMLCITLCILVAM